MYNPEPIDLRLDGVYFLPWVGTNYLAQSPRLLLLGESHYGDNNENPNLTRELTYNYSEGLWSHRYWTGIMNTLNDQNTPDARNVFWSKVAFYNYIQDIVGATSGIQPTAAMFVSALTGFRSVLNYLKPTHILVLEKRLWLNLPTNLLSSRDIVTFGGVSREIATFEFDGGGASATWINHPSRSSPKRWHPIVKDFLATKKCI